MSTWVNERADKRHKKENFLKDLENKSFFFDYIDYEESKNYKNDYSLIGDNSKLRSIGWEPTYTIDKLIDNMVKKEFNYENIVC